MGEYDEIKDQVLALMKKKKKKMTPKDLRKSFPDIKPKALKKATSEMILEGTIAYWSSGSSTYFSLPEGILEERKKD